MNPTIMNGQQIVYVSELLKEKFPSAHDNLIGVLEKHGIPHAYLKGTKDIWCKDYMPVQTSSGKLVQFKYDPSYLKGNKEWEESRSDVREVCRLNGFNPVFSDIIIDGGNVLICDDRAILTDRIFSENANNGKYADKDVLLKELSELLEAEIIIFPTIKDGSDFTGHADGYVRFINRDSIVGNERRVGVDYKYWLKDVDKMLTQYKLEYKDVPIFEHYDKRHPDSAIGIYVNYLEVGNLIVIPSFGVEGNRDAEALECFRKIFPDRIIEAVDYNDVAYEGGIINCSTWSLRL